MSEFDLVVLGGGPGGYAAALYGASAGLNIAMVEQSRVGGTCLHRGCIPAKELLQTAEVLPDGRQRGRVRCAVRRRLPWTCRSPRSASKRSIDRLTSGLESLAEGPQGDGRRRHRHARARRSHRARLGRNRAPRHQRVARDRVVAARVAAPGLRVRRQRSCCRRITSWSSTACRRALRSSVAARSAASSRRSSSTSGPRSRSSRRCRRSSPASTSKSRNTVVRAFTKRGIKVRGRREGRAASTGTVRT